MLRDGYVQLKFTDGGSVSFQLSEYDQVLTAWRDGQRWYEGTDPYGDALTVCLDDLRYVARNTAAGLAASREETRLDKLEGVE